GRETAQGAERAELHGVAEVGDQREARRRPLAANDLVDRLDAAHRADAAGRALAARFDAAELEREAGLLRHVDGVVEYHDAAMADQPVPGGEGFVVERRVEQCAREVGAKRAAHLNRAHWPAAKRASADIVDDLAERQAEG